MPLAYYKYEEMDDRQIIDLALKGTDEAILYMIYDRYDPLLKKLCKRYYDDLFYYEQLQTEVYIHLKSKDWHALRSFGWQSSFGTWLGVVAGNLFIKKIPELIGISKFTVSIGEDVENKEVNIPEPEPIHELDMNMVLLIEGIHQLEDKDQRFILYKEFEGYHPKEIAGLLENYRRREERLKTRVKDGVVEEIIPTPEYIHMLKGRAKDNLRDVINELKKEFKW